jgi:hypothetical protein
MTINLDTLHLEHGSHVHRGDGVCLLEAVAWFAGEPHTDRPACVSPVLGAYGRYLNDILPEPKRQELRTLIPLLPGTAGDGKDETRGYLALDWLIRTWTPAWLSLAGLTSEAQAIRDLRPIVDLAAAESAGPVVWHASQKAAAAWDAAWGAARGAARAAAWDAARGAARGAAWDAAWDAARDAARDAAWDAVRGALAPTVAQLQDSAIALYQAMITGVGDE